MEGLECGTVVGTNPYKTKSHQLFSAMPADWPSAGRGRKQRTLQGLYEVRSTNADAPAMAMRPSEVVLARARAAGKGGVATDGAVASPFRLPLSATGLAGVAPRSRDEGPNESIRQDVAMSPCRHAAMAAGHPRRGSWPRPEARPGTTVQRRGSISVGCSRANYECNRKQPGARAGCGCEVCNFRTMYTRNRYQAC